ncbi:MAG: hypothetical protein J0L67_02365 [Cytophagales bacterium]|nr:hypothetical protein [Cytophagales bacterium]
MKLLKFARIVALLFIFHIVFSLFLIVSPTFNAGLLTLVYRKYLLPGPFFTKDRIEQSYSLLLSCQVGNVWQPVSQPALENYHRLMATGNPKAMLQARLDRYFYYQYVISKHKNPNVQINPEFEQLINYYQNYFPVGTDSVKLIFVKKETTDFAIKVDTLYTIKHGVD